MLLARHASLGSLPATIVLVALAVVVVTLAHALIEVARAAPVLLVADAPAVARASPARADAAYVDAFVRGFLEDWASWTPYTVRARRDRALARLAPAARAALAPAVERCAPLLESLQQSQTLRIDELQPTDLGGGRIAVRVRGRLETYFGGVGGSPDTVAGEVLLQTVRATRAEPRCLAVTSVRLAKLAAAEADAPTSASVAAVADPLAPALASQLGAFTSGAADATARAERAPASSIAHHRAAPSRGDP